MDRIRCYNCQRIGTHLSKNCPIRRVDRCWSCGQEGHEKAQCPKRARGSRIGLVSSHTNKAFRRIAKAPRNQLVRVFIDTGSEFNLITLACARAMGANVIPTKYNLYGFGGGRSTTVGETKVGLEIDQVKLTVDAAVVKEELANSDIILGQPAFLSVGLMVQGGKARVTSLGDSEGRSPYGGANPNTESSPHVRRLDRINWRGHTAGVSVGKGGQSDDENKYSVAKPIEEQAGGKRKRPHETPIRQHMHVRTVEAEASGETGQIGNITAEEEAGLRKILHQNAACFSEGDGDVGLTDLGAMNIELTTDKPVAHRPYRLSCTERRIVRDKVQELVKGGIVRESDSDYASPIILIPKKDGTWRLCVDYRRLNAITVKDRYPLPLIADQLDRLAGKKYFTTLDLAQGYHQVPMDPNSIHKTAFITPDGQYEYLRVPFGLANAPAVFQRIVNKMLGNLRHTHVLAYMDDLLIPTETIAAGLELLDTVLRLIRRAGVKLNFDKCSFLQDHVEFLGHEISGEGVRPGRRKIEAVRNFPIPRDVHGVRQFVGLASYFRKYIRNFATLARPLTMLTHKDAPWTWNEEHQGAFEKLKHTLITRPVLALYDGDAVTELHTDASKLGIGAILIQFAPGGDGGRPVAYYSRATTRIEESYHSYELETMAVVEALRRFRVYLVGIHFKVVTDCTAVRATFVKKDLIPRIARWWLSVQEFNMEVVYRPGPRMQHADALSRNPLTVNIIQMSEDDWFATVQIQDEKAQAIITAIKGGAADKELKATFSVDHGRLYRKTTLGPRLYVPAMARFTVLRKHHDDIGHLGYERCLGLIKQTYWFPRMSRFVKKYVSACINCAFAKGDYGRGAGKLHPIQKTSIPFDTVHIDHLGPFVRSRKGNSYLLMVVDAFTKFTLAKPTRTLRSTEAVEKLRGVFGEFGYPRRIISDRGLAFTSKDFASFLTDKGIKHVLNAIATPRANGQVERQNRTIIEAIAASAVSDVRWDERLPEIIWGMNHAANASTRFSPAELLFAYKNSLVADLSNSTSGEADLREELTTRRQRAAANIEEAAIRYKEQYDKKRARAELYSCGDLVLWRRAMTHTGDKGVSQKARNKYDGPYKVVEVCGNDRYKIQSLSGLRGYRRYTATAAVDALRRYHSTMEGDDEAGDQSETDGEVVDREDLIDLLES